MEGSYKNSTLSMMLVWRGVSLPVLMLTFAGIGIFVPKGYELISQDKLLVGILLGAYIVFGMQLLSAYLQRSPSKTPEVETVIKEDAIVGKADLEVTSQD